MFTKEIKREEDVWLDSQMYCGAMESLLRLAARDTERFGDMTGDKDKPQVHQIVC